MRVRPANTDTCSKHAKSLKRALEGCGVASTLSAAQNAIGRMHGYRSWHEMAVAARAPGKPSPFDEDVDPTECAERRTRQVSALIDSYGLPRDRAEALVDGIAPTARIRPGGTRDPRGAAEASWRSLLASARKPDGFIGFDPTAWTRPATASAYASTEGSAKIEVWCEATRCPKTEEAFATTLTAAMTVEGRVVAILEGVGASVDLAGPLAFPETRDQLRRSEKGEDMRKLFRSIAKDVSFDAMRAVREARDKVGFYIGGHDAQQPANGLLLIRRWEAAHGLAPSGSGSALVKAAWSALQARNWGCGVFLIDPSPLQFEALEGNVHVRYDFRLARDRVEQHLVNITVEEEERPFPQILCYEATWKGEGTKTPTVVSEPRPMDWPHDWPDGHDRDWLIETRNIKVAPHGEFWRSMPSDLLSLTVGFEEYESESEGMTPYPKDLDFRFANGSALTLSLNEIDDMSEFRGVPLYLQTPRGEPLAENPYTDRMGLQDMFDVLVANVWLAFAGNPDLPGRCERRVTVSRSTN